LDILKSKNGNKYLGLVSVLGILFSNLAHATSVTPVLALNYGRGSGTTTASPNLGFHSPTYGGGVLVEAKVSSGLGIEWGGLYILRGFVSTDSSTQYTFYTVEFPLLLKFHVGKVFSLGVGGYYAHHMGNIYLNPVSDKSAISYEGYGTASISTEDCGFALSLGFAVGLVPRIALVVDARYLLGLKNISLLEGSGIKMTDYQVLAGLRFGG
jgi:hypothetical protein